MREGLLLRILLGLGIVANLALLAINVRPERPHLNAARKMTLLLHAEAPAVKWIEQNELSEFGKAHDVTFDVQTADSYADILARLEKEKTRSTGVLLTVIDDELSDDVRSAKTVRPLDGLAPPEELDEISECLDDAVHFCKVDGKTWFWPKRGEMTVAVSVRPAVEDAYLHWNQDEKAIDAALKEANGYGLPRGYHLEKEPDDWDSYDLFVAAWYWAHHPAPWADPSHPDSDKTRPMPRVAWRTGPNDDASYDLLGRFYRQGMTDAQMGKTDVAPVVDALQWEALIRKYHLLVPEAEDPKGITEDAMNDLFKAGRLAWAPMDQEDSFWLHGAARRDAPPGMEKPERLNWSIMPVGASQEMKDGASARVGRSYAFQKYELWAVPVGSPDPQLAYELARFLSQRGIAQRETEALGMMPPRKDIRDNYPILFRLAWMQDVLDASYRQLAHGGGGQMPESVAEQRLDEKYTKLRAAVLARDPLPITYEGARAAISEGAHAP